jgi:DNA-binding HxlR family transcriptional regulator
MAARLAMAVDPRERLRRLAVVFAVSLRLKIVAELYMREMSAQQFYEEFGGGTSSRVSQNFTSLEKGGWLRFLYSKGPGGSRHGGVERFYRASELPYFDHGSWALLPYSVRCTVSLSMFRAIEPELRRDIEASRNHAEDERSLKTIAVTVDQAGRARIIDAVSTVFARIYEMQEDARRRSLQSGEGLFQADVLLAAFRSPGGSGLSAAGDLLIECPREPLTPFPERLAPILADEVRRDIVSQTNSKELSVTQFHREFGGTSKSGLSRRFKGLEGGGWLIKVRSRRRGGATEQFYRATKPAIQSYEPLTEAAAALSDAEEWQAFEHLCESVREAMLAGTFDAMTDRFLSWSMLRLDRQGWADVLAAIEALRKEIVAEERQARQRIAKTGETPITVTFAAGGFEAPSGLIKAP